MSSQETYDLGTRNFEELSMDPFNSSILRLISSALVEFGVTGGLLPSTIVTGRVGEPAGHRPCSFEPFSFQQSGL